MKRLLILLMLFVAPIAHAQTNTFCASNLTCNVSSPWTFATINAMQVVDGVTNTTVQQAVNKLPSGGGNVYIPCGSYAGPTLPTNGWGGVRLISLCSPLNPVIGIGGVFFPSSVTSATLTYSVPLTITNAMGLSFDNVVFDFSASTTGNLTLAGVSHSYFRMAVRCPLGSTGGNCVTTTDGGAANQNMAINNFDLLWTYGGNEGLKLTGTANPGRATTNNTFQKLVIVQSFAVGLDFTQFCDSNWFRYTLIIPATTSATYQPIIFNSGTPGSDVDVESEEVDSLTVGAPSSGTCVNGVTFNTGNGNYVFADEIGCTNNFTALAAANYRFETTSQGGTPATPPTVSSQGYQITELSSTANNATHTLKSPDFTAPLVVQTSTASSSNSADIVLKDTAGPLGFHLRKSGGSLCFLPDSGTPSICGALNGGTSYSGLFGISLNGTTGTYQSKRAVAGCTTAASIGGTCASDITVTWNTAFPDANYSVTCTGSTPTAVPAAPFVVSGTKLAATVHINYFAITAVAASYATIDCIAVHD